MKRPSSSGLVSRRWQSKFLLTILSILFAFFIAELALRLIGFSHPRFHAFDDQTGWMHRPNAAGWFRDEGEAYVKINSAGMRDREHNKEKPSHTYRVAVLGDSFAEALQVPTEQTFWYLLETRLAACPALAGRQIEVLNFGVSNYGTAQELLTLRTRVWDYAPDLVLLLFTPANDLRNNVRALEGDGLRPYFAYQGDQLVADMSFRTSTEFRRRRTRLSETFYETVNHIRLLQLFMAGKDALQRRRVVAAQGEGATAMKSGLEDHAFIPPRNEQWNSAWRVTEGLITQMNQEVRSKGARFLVISGTYGGQVHPDPAQRSLFSQRLGVMDLSYPGRRIEDLGARTGFDVLDLAPPFQNYAQRHGTPLHGFYPNLNMGHWNVAGHRLASELIAAEICP